MNSTVIEESQVPAYKLPDPLTLANGKPVTTGEHWQMRRAELLELFERHQYGFPPKASAEINGEILLETPDALNCAATMKQIELRLKNRARSLSIGLLLFLPNKVSVPIPAFLGLNFYGNHTIHPHQRIFLHQNWSPDSTDLKVSGNRSTGASRGLRAYRWPVEEIIARGYALATLYCGDIDPDFDDGFKNGVHGLFDETDHIAPSEERWGTIAAWSWGLSRILDYIAKEEPAIDSQKVIAIGHSRMGKAALWAAASDERFAAAISNNSGCAGAALQRRRFGERLVNLNTTFPHWLNGRSKAYNEKEDDLPIDQHQLLALIAPRTLYVASAAEDLWADPKGEFLSLLHAEPVWRLLGVDSNLPSHQPPIGDAIQGPLSYHIRPGKHDILAEDWAHFLDFADREVR